MMKISLALDISKVFQSVLHAGRFDKLEVKVFLDDFWI